MGDYIDEPTYRQHAVRRESELFLLKNPDFEGIEGERVNFPCKQGKTTNVPLYG